MGTSRYSDVFRGPMRTATPLNTTSPAFYSQDGNGPNDSSLFLGHRSQSQEDLANMHKFTLSGMQTRDEEGDAHASNEESFFSKTSAGFSKIAKDLHYKPV